MPCSCRENADPAAGGDGGEPQHREVLSEGVRLLLGTLINHKTTNVDRLRALPQLTFLFQLTPSPPSRARGPNCCLVDGGAGIFS